MECIPDAEAEEPSWMLLIGPNPKDGDTRGEFRAGLMTEKGEPKMLVGLLDPELFCCEDMATTLPRELV